MNDNNIRDITINDLIDKFRMYNNNEEDITYALKVINCKTSNSLITFNLYASNDNLFYEEIRSNINLNESEYIGYNLLFPVVNTKSSSSKSGSSLISDEIGSRSMSSSTSIGVSSISSSRHSFNMLYKILFFIV